MLARANIMEKATPQKIDQFRKNSLQDPFEILTPTKEKNPNPLLT